MKLASKQGLLQIRVVKHWLNGIGMTLLAALLSAAGLANDSAAPVAAPVAAAPSAAPANAKGPAKVVVIPIREQISKPMLYILRRGLKEAITQGADTVVLDMKTPGGELGVTFEMLEALGKFPGKTVTYINSEGISAGALIAAGTDDIYFAPDGVIGAAAPVNATGEDIDATMKAKIVSYLKARIRSISQGKNYRAEVLSAMIDIDFELKIDDAVIKPKGELLTLTAQEAMQAYGASAQPLLGSGIAANVDGLLDKLHGPGNYSISRLELSWSENVAQYLTSIAPLLMALGMLCLFIEFKTPGFGVFGISGGILLGLVFFGHFAAGLSGHEPALFFLLGLALLAVEVFFFPGTVIMAVCGLVLMLGSLVWSMADLWPKQPLAFSGDVFLRPLINVLAGVILAVLAFIALLKFLPQGGPWGQLVLDSAVGGEPLGVQALGGRNPANLPIDALIGQSGVAATPLFPSGQVEVAGRRYEARMAMGFADAGSQVRVTGRAEFSLIVELIQS
jgi:membrane-bound serine protease (ClpP class)